MAAALVAGCGDEGVGAPSGSLGGVPEPAGTLRVALADGIDTLDPLLADERAERLASRQIHEPLFSRQAGPFGGMRRLPGLARSFSSSAAGTIWTAKLRRSVRFQDGEPLDADAVVANAERWLSVQPGPRLLPELTTAFSPRPGVVRFLLDRSTPGFPRELGSPQLGLVAPNALVGIGASPIRPGTTGTGPFELREREARRTLLARYGGWWGAGLDLGPGVDQLELVEIPRATLRVDELEAGNVEVADGLDAVSLSRVEQDPLLATVRSGSAALGLERSVRGIDSAQAGQSLADAWLTDLR